MTEEEAKKALFEINLEYMSHTPKERIKLYDDYTKKRGEIRKELAQAIRIRREKELKLK